MRISLLNKVVSCPQNVKKKIIKKRNLICKRQILQIQKISAKNEKIHI